MDLSASDQGGHRPRIGITTYLEEASWGIWNRRAALLPETYLDAVVAAGGVPLLIPPTGTGTAALDVLDGLIVAGGCDVDPASYGASPHPETTGTQPSRDTSELVLIEAALSRDLPLLAVCRGLQMLNVTLGGTLQQHLPDRVGHDAHRPSPAVFGTSTVQVEPSSRLAEIVGDKVDVPCYHHQAVDRLGDGLRVTATAADGTVEGVEVTGQSFALGIQWHPEEDLSDIRLFTALIRAAS